MAVSAEPSVQAPGTRLKVKQWIFAGIPIWFEVVDAAMELPIIHDAASAASALVNYVSAVSVHFYWIEMFRQRHILQRCPPWLVLSTSCAPQLKVCPCIV